MKYKLSLFIIIILLLISGSFTIIGYVNKSNINDNPNNDLYYDNKIWFYENDKLKGIYNCLSNECKLANSNLDKDTEYKINYNSESKDEIIGNYVFIMDEEIVLYDVNNNKVISTFNSFNNYNNMYENAIVVNDNGKYGVIKYNDIIENVIPFEYDFIGLSNKLDDNNMLIDDYFIVCKDNIFSIIDKTGLQISSNINNVITDYYIIDNYLLIIKDDIIGVYNKDNNMLYEDIKFSGEYEEISINIENEMLYILVDEKVVGNIAI